MSCHTRPVNTTHGLVLCLFGKQAELKGSICPESGLVMGYLPRVWLGDGVFALSVAW